MGTADRTLDHQGLEVLDTATCWELLASTPVGRIAFVDAGEPAILPVNHAVAGHRVVFRTARGTLLHEALTRQPVAFEADGYDEAARTGWSVVVRGVADLAETPLPPGEGPRPWADSVPREDLVEIRVEEITGRRIMPTDA